MARAPVRRGHADVVLALLGAEPLESDDDGVAGGEALGGGRVDEFLRLGVELLVGDAPLDQRVDLAEREQRVLIGQHALAEGVAESWSGQTTSTRLPRRVAHVVAGGEDAAADADIGGARGTLGLAGLARAIGRPTTSARRRRS